MRLYFRCSCPVNAGGRKIAHQYQAITSTLLVYHSLYRAWGGVVFAFILVIAGSLISTCCADPNALMVVVPILFVIALLICVMCAGILGFVALIVPVVVVGPIVVFILCTCCAGG